MRFIILQRQIDIYHISHIDNLASIIQENGLWSDSKRIERGLRYNKIGYQHIKDRRLRRPVAVAAGGFLGDYVPFYFAPRSPMLYTINKGSVPDYDEGQQPIVHLVSNVNIILSTSAQFAFTDRHADLAWTAYSDDINQIDNMVDFNIMQNRMWNNTSSNPDRMERRQAEFLVHHFFPWNNITMIAVVNKKIAENVQVILQTADYQPSIALKPNWYYN